MNAAEGGKPPIVIGRRWRVAALVLGVAALHALLLQQAQAPKPRRAGPVVSLQSVERVTRAVPVASVAPQAHAPAPARERPQPPAVAKVAKAAAEPAAASSAAPPPVPAEPRASSVAVADLELPVYPTRLPPPLHWQYRFQRGTAAGSAELHWQPGDGRYQARFSGEAGGAPAFEWTSTGALDGAGVAPERYLDRRRGRGAQAANFRRDSGRISYSGPAVEWPLPAGAQDRLSWLPQLAGIVAAAPARWREGQEIRLFVSGARGDADVWTFRVAGRETVAELPGGPVETLRLLREPDRPYDLRAEVWLDPARHHMPVKARFSSGTVVWELQWAAELNP
jgi:hypothetical protein